jgi:hypothetical protein
VTFLAKDTSKKLPIIPADIHHGICVGVVDLGTHHSDRFGKDIHKLLINFELPDQRMESEEGNRPRLISKRYTLSMHQKSTLRKDIESWLGKHFTDDELKNGWDLEQLLGKNAQIQIIHNPSNDGQVYANINTIMPYKGEVCEAETEFMFFSFDNGLEDELPANIPDWIQDIIKKSNEYRMIIDARENVSAKTF